jgi:hypothetical protein
MADSDPTPHRPQTLTPAHLQRLADRLVSRGTSSLLSDSPEMQADMRVAAQVIRALLSKLDKAAGSVAETARLLAEVRIEVEA